MVENSLAPSSELVHGSLKEIRIARGVSIVSPYPALYFEEEKALIVSDTHIGIENERRDSLLLPVSCFSTMLASLVRPVKEMNCKKIVILGDLKHSFRKLHGLSQYLVHRFVRELRTAGAEPLVVKGNHDKYLGYDMKALGVEFLNEAQSTAGFVLAHGHNRVSSHGKSTGSNIDDCHTLVIGHEHPAIRLPDSLGRRQTFKSFLVLETTNNNKSCTGAKRIIVLPSANPLAYGTPVNEVESRELLSPYLRENKSLGKATPYLVEVGTGVQRFPDLSTLRGFCGS
jgi:putative SbcD/Mre11-related phosphoesterase